MEELFSLQAKTGSRVFATSRPILGIPKDFERRGSSILEIRSRDKDMRRYLDGHIVGGSVWHGYDDYKTPSWRGNPGL
jgi:hypothetical protein